MRWSRRSVRMLRGESEVEKGGPQGPPLPPVREQRLELRLRVDGDVAVQHVGSLRVRVRINRGSVVAGRGVPAWCDAIWTKRPLVSRITGVLHADADVLALKVSEEVAVGLRHRGADVREPWVRWRSRRL